MTKKEIQALCRQNKELDKNLDKWFFCTAPTPARTGYQKSGSKGAKSAVKGK